MTELGPFADRPSTEMPPLVMSMSQARLLESLGQAKIDPDGRGGMAFGFKFVVTVSNISIDEIKKAGV